MRKDLHGRLPRFAGTAAAAAFLMFLSACAGNGETVSAEKAFTLSASALAGTDNFRFDGEVSIFDPNGVLAVYSQYAGKVTGHGELELQWSGGGAAQARASEGPPAFHPLQLLEAVRMRDAKVSRAGTPGMKDTVLLRIELEPEAASDQLAEGLRSEIAKLKEETAGRELTPEEREQAGSLLANAEQSLEAALSSLKAQSVYYWEADRDSWFPLELTERTTLTYEWRGKTCTENRSSATHFLPEGGSDTMGRNP